LVVRLVAQTSSLRGGNSKKWESSLIFFLTKLMKGLSFKLEGEGGVLSRFVRMDPKTAIPRKLQTKKTSSFKFL